MRGIRGREGCSGEERDVDRWKEPESKVGLSGEEKLEEENLGWMDDRNC